MFTRCCPLLICYSHTIRSEATRDKTRYYAICHYDAIAMAMLEALFYAMSAFCRQEMIIYIRACRVCQVTLLLSLCDRYAIRNHYY